MKGLRKYPVSGKYPVCFLLLLLSVALLSARTLSCDNNDQGKNTFQESTVNSLQFFPHAFGTNSLSDSDVQPPSCINSIIYSTNKLNTFIGYHITCQTVTQQQTNRSWLPEAYILLIGTINNKYIQFQVSKHWGGTSTENNIIISELETKQFIFQSCHK